MATGEQTERTALTRRAVVETALAKADAEGLEAVSFRRLAADLGVTPMALYHYVESKEELIAAIADRVFEEFELPDEDDPDWRRQLRELARSYRKLLLAHPGLVPGFLVDASQISPNAARVIEVVLRTLRRAGFSAKEAALLENELARSVIALVMLETGGARWQNDQEREVHVRELRARLLTLPPDDFPNLVEAAPYICEFSDPDWAFEFALDLLNGGLEALLEQRRSATTER